jgi:hypothetical protein
MIIRAGLLGLSMLLAVPGAACADMVVRSSDSSGSGCMKMTLTMRQLNSSAIRVVAHVDRLAVFRFNEASPCKRVSSCAFVWLKRTMTLGENKMTVTATTETCSLGISGYVDMQ